jgi:hypothetical protein
VHASCHERLGSLHSDALLRLAGIGVQAHVTDVEGEWSGCVASALRSS